MGIKYNFNTIENEKKCKFIKEESFKIQPLLSNNYLNNKLFTFLIENNMNRYVFGYIIGIHKLNLDSIAMNEKLLSKTELMNKCGESFIKKYHCPECGNLIFRKHIYDFKYNDSLNVECLNCGKESYFTYFDLENDFEINRNDLIKFMDKLVEYEIFSKKHVIICNKCTKTSDFNIENINDLTCEKCGNICEIRFKYECNFPFLTEGGYWFEWYVYNICKDLYKHVFPNYKCEYELNGETQLCDFDILAIDSNKKVIVYECKDYMRYNKNQIPLAVFIENLSKIRHVSDEIFLVSSTKNIKKSSKSEINDLMDDNIKFIEGMDLEKQFLSEESIIRFFEEQNYDIVHLYSKLPTFMKTKILKKILELMVENTNLTYIHSLLNIFTYSEINDLIIPKQIWISSVQRVLDNIYSDNLIPASLNYINDLFHLKPKIFEGIIDLNMFIEKGMKFLNPNPYEGSDKRAPFYYFITDYLENISLDTTILKYETINEFLLKFIPMLDVYYGAYSVEKTLNVFFILWDFLDQNIEEKLTNQLISEYTHHPNKRYVIKQFISKDLLNSKNKIKWDTFIEEFNK